jgi:DNA-directed RNA polymerase subunit K/omega
MPMLKEPRHKATQVAQKEILHGLVKFRIPDRNGDQGEEEEKPE